MIRFQTDRNRDRLHRGPEAFPQAVCAPRASEHAESPAHADNQTDGQIHDFIQTEREPHPPILDECTREADNDVEDPTTQSSITGAITHPGSYSVSREENNYHLDPDFFTIEFDLDSSIDLDLDLELSRILQTEDTQMFEAHSTTGHTTDPLPLGNDSHVDAGETERLNSDSHLREMTPVEEDATWEVPSPPSDFFDLSWLEYEEVRMPK